VILVLLTLLGLADPARPLARTDEALTERTWWTVEHVDQGPARPRWRNRRGAWHCWTFPDGIAARCQERDGRTLVSERRFDAGGRPLTTLRYADGEPDRVVVHGGDPVEVSVTGAGHATLGPLQLSGPGEPTTDPNGTVRWSLPQGELSATLAPAGTDPRSDAFVTALRQSCACIVEDRSTTWLWDQTAVRYRVRQLDPDAPTLSELWLMPAGEQVLILRFTTPAADPLATVQSRLAHGRAWVALAHPAPESP